MSATVLFEQRGRVGIVTLAVPAKRNAVSMELRIALRERLSALNVDRECSAIVLTGAGDHFCAGGDVSEMTSGKDDPLFAVQRLKVLHDIVRLLFAGNKPVVAAVQGVAAGAGFSLAAACDVIVAAHNSRFVASFTKLGLIADCGLQFTLSARAGAARAKRFLMSGEAIGAEDALALGFIDQLAPPNQVLAQAIEIAAGFAAMPPLGLAATKSSFSRAMASLDDALSLEIDLQSRLAATADHAEARAAFLEHRLPSYSGR